MKRSLLLGSLALAISTATVSATTYNGNAGGGFGGPVGGSMLSVTNDPSTGLITFQLTTASTTTDQIVFYFDSTAGGFNDTSTLTDANLTTDAGRRAVTGTDGISRSTVTFATGFGADYGLDLSGGNSTLYQLTSGSLTYNSSPTTTLNGNVFTFTLSATTLGVAPGGTFSFVANLLNPYDGTDKDANGNSIAVYRSNESLGTSVSSTGTAINSNPGTAGTLTFSTADSYTLTTAAVPEPSAALSLSAGAVLLGIGYAVRRRKHALVA